MTAQSINPSDVYGFFDIWWEACMGETAPDFTEGIYGDQTHDTKSLEDAQHDQRAWVLDAAQVTRGTRLLEVGCGLGSLLRDASERGARPVGITPNPHQVEVNQQRGLDVRQYSWDQLDGSFEGSFDAIVANGSLEHYVTREDAVQGLQAGIYRRFFEKCAASLDPKSDNRRVALTFISFNDAPDPVTVGRPTSELPRMSHEYHVRLLERMYRGWYPDGKEQVLDAAAPYFDVVEEQDGTRDYWITSLEWGRRARPGLLRKLPFLLPRLVRWARSDPDFWDRMLSFIYGSWAWQFGGERPPCALNRVALRLR